MKKILVLAMALSAFQTARAYRVEWGREVRITTPVYEDLYVAAGTIYIDAPVYGDLIVAGGTIHINDTVMNDLLLAGGNVIVKGYIADDIRCAGGELSILSGTGGDLVITGGRVLIGENVMIGGGLIASGGEIKLHGTINGDVKCAVGSLEFYGKANRNFEARGENLLIDGSVQGLSVLAARQITIGQHAGFYNDVRFWNKSGNLDFAQSIKNGSFVYDPTLKIKTGHWFLMGYTSVLGLLWYLATIFIFILLLQFLFKRIFQKAGSTVDHSLLRSLGYGLLFFIGIPFIILFLLVTIIGIPIGVLLMLAYIVMVLLATTITSLVISNWYNNRFRKNWSYIQITGWAFAIFIILKFLTMMPLLGWLIMILMALISFGSIARSIHVKKRAVVVGEV